MSIVEFNDRQGPPPPVEKAAVCDLRLPKKKSCLACRLCEASVGLLVGWQVCMSAFRLVLVSTGKRRGCRDPFNTTLGEAKTQGPSPGFSPASRVATHAIYIGALANTT